MSSRQGKKGKKKICTRNNHPSDKSDIFNTIKLKNCIKTIMPLITMKHCYLLKVLTIHIVYKCFFGVRTHKSRYKRENSKYKIVRVNETNF